MEFETFPKIARYKKRIVITEKVDGSNAQIGIVPILEDTRINIYYDPNCIAVISGESDGDTAHAIYAGSRNRWLTPGKTSDNFGFAAWVFEHAKELVKLGPGRHFGEWYGKGIQRGYGLEEKRFALFNTDKWRDEAGRRPACCGVVPVILEGEEADAQTAMSALAKNGSLLVPGFNNPEGIVIFHTGSHTYLKQTFDKDGGKWKE